MSNTRHNKVSDGEEKEIKVGNYLIGKTIGEGTFGQVKSAIHTMTGEKVAVKILEKGRFKDADTVRVNREIKILKKSRHSNIIQLYEVVDTQSTIYLMMEMSDGGEMFDFIVANRKLDEPMACNFFHQIINGLEVLHNNFITHRDLKPENLLLKSTSKGYIIKIVDFGLSNTHEGGKLLQTACGSPCYAAPEMIAGKKYVGPLVDIWSCGVILFTLVCGYLPFEDQNTSHLYKKILAGNYATPKWISVNVKELIRKILEVKPTKRYSIQDIRQHKWFGMVNESEIPFEDILVINNPELESKTMNELKKHGFKKEDVLEGIANNYYNQSTASYFLMKQKNYELIKKTIPKSSIAAAAEAVADTSISSEVKPDTPQDMIDKVEAVTVLVSQIKVVENEENVTVPSENEHNAGQHVNESESLLNPQTQQEAQLRQLQKFRESQQKRQDKSQTHVNSNQEPSQSPPLQTATATAVSTDPSQSISPTHVQPANTDVTLHVGTPIESDVTSIAIESNTTPINGTSVLQTVDNKNNSKLDTSVIRTSKDSITRIPSAVEIATGTSTAVEPKVIDKSVLRTVKNLVAINFPKIKSRTTTTNESKPPMDATAIAGKRSSRGVLNATAGETNEGPKETSSRKKGQENIPDMFKSTPYPALPVPVINLTLKPQNIAVQNTLVQSAPTTSMRSSGTSIRKGRHLLVPAKGADPLANVNAKLAKEFDGIALT